MGKTKFQQRWKLEYPWLKELPNDETRAFCTICLSRFRIDNSGIAQVRSHAQRHDSGSSTEDSKQRKFVVSGSSTSLSKKVVQKCIAFSPEDQVTNAEIIQALHHVDNNHSFASASTDTERFQKMFPDSQIAKDYEQGKTKIKYNIQFGIAPFIKEQLMAKIKGIPYTFKFDETTTTQVKKQYDGYVQFWDTSINEVVNVYCGSLFVGHCGADALVKHFLHFMRELKLDPRLLLGIGMDGPNVNLSFERKLRNHLEQFFDTNFLPIGTCSLHPAHTAFKKGMSCLSCDVDKVFHDLYFFFKLSSARREDYVQLEAVTNVIAHFMLRHVECRWLSMKNVAVRVIQQYANLKAYFLTFLPKSKEFRQLQKSERYQNITARLKNPLTEFYISFTAFVTNEFESFLLPFQSDEPKIHLLYPGMCKLVSTITAKFIKKKFLSDDFAANVSLLETDKDKHKPLNLIDVGSKCKSLLSDPFLSNHNTKLRTECLDFYVTAVTYLKENMPFNKVFIKQAQYLHPEKRNHASARNSVSNMTNAICKVLGNKFPKIFGLRESASKEDVIDKVRSQWQIYQSESIPEEWFKKKEEPGCIKKPAKQGYWAEAYKLCGLEEPDTRSVYKRADYYWSKVGELLDENGNKKYPQLLVLARCALSVTHGNGFPERGFSINRFILESHGTRLDEETIIALRTVKDELCRVGGALKFPLSEGLRKSVKGARAKYRADQEERKKIAEAKKVQERIDERAVAEQKRMVQEREEIDKELARCDANLQVASQIIEEGNKRLLDGLNSKTLDRKILQDAQSRIDTGIERKRKIEEEAASLRRKKMRLSNK